MLKGIYTAAAGMLSTDVLVDSLANNLANISTIGFKGSHVNFQSFPEMLLQKVSQMGQKAIGGIMTGNQVMGSYVNQLPGALKQTGNPLDLALQGDGYFTVKSSQNQTFYTRAGNFTLDKDGYLSTTDGMRVQGKQGDIQLNTNDGPFTIDTQGVIKGKTQVEGQLEITRFTDNQSLEKLRGSLYTTGPTTQKRPPDSSGSPSGYTVAQGSLEESNVNPVIELVSTIQGQRLYEALQKNIHMHNETLEKAVNEVGRYK